MLDRTKFSCCSLPVVVPEDYAVFLRQDLANLIKCLGAALNYEPCTVCLSDYRSALRLAGRLVALSYSEQELHDAGIFIFDADEEA